jgi:hypothetical protein
VEFSDDPEFAVRDAIARKHGFPDGAAFDAREPPRHDDDHAHPRHRTLTFPHPPPELRISVLRCVCSDCVARLQRAEPATGIRILSAIQTRWRSTRHRDRVSVSGAVSVHPS